MTMAQFGLREVLGKNIESAIVNQPCGAMDSKSSSQLVIIVERKEDWSKYFPSEDLVTAQEYLEQPRDR